MVTGKNQHEIFMTYHFDPSPTVWLAQCAKLGSSERIWSEQSAITPVEKRKSCQVVL